MSQPQYPPQPAQYPPQYPQQPAQYPPQYPQQPAQYPPQYGQQPQYPPQYTPPPPVTARGSIDDFYDQPAATGKSIAAWFQVPGQSITGVIARELTNADTRQQTDMITKAPSYYSDGRPKLTLTIPLLVQPTQDFPDGRAAWIIGPGDREDLDAAMQAAGCAPRTVPEAGAVVTITFTGLKQIPGFGAPKKVKSVQYQRPRAANGNGQAVSPPATAPAPSAVPATPAAPAIAVSQPPPPFQPAAAPPVPATSSQPQPAAGLTPEQQELLARLTGQQGQ